MPLRIRRWVAQVRTGSTQRGFDQEVQIKVEHVCFSSGIVLERLRG